MRQEDFGWDQFFEERFQQFKEDGFFSGRVVSENKNFYRLLTTSGEITAKCSGKMFYKSDKADMPVAGDWVVFRTTDDAERQARIHHVLPRKSKFSRKVAGRVVREHPVAANIDTIFLMTGLDQDFNLRRIERYLTLAWESGARPVVLLNKSDICRKAKKLLKDTKKVITGVPIHILSALKRSGFRQLSKYLKKGRTVAFLGSSGVGKSTLLNSLLGKDVQKVQELTDYGKGVHTTRQRELFILPSGAMVIDTPGIREIQLWTVEKGMGEAFSDIKDISAGCRFSDCRHIHEPDCAVKIAVEDGKLVRERYNNYIRMQKELRFLEERHDSKALRERKAEEKKISKNIKGYKRIKKDKKG